ncbi:MAG: hypothetical protein MUP13_03275 [Thermoanaerobaculales bacterium]|nr:hypothetical protein [Thermoanaerobaculales bacterium]
MAQTGSSVKALISRTAPTVLGCLDVAGPDALRGRDQRHLIDGSSRQIDSTVEIYAESPAYGPDSWAVISDGWKLIERVDGVVLLFDLNNDPSESVDLALEYPRQVREMRDKAITIRASLVAVQPIDPDTLDEATEEQLRVLGYVE